MSHVNPFRRPRKTIQKWIPSNVLYIPNTQPTNNTAVHQNRKV